MEPGSGAVHAGGGAALVGPRAGSKAMAWGAGDKGGPRNDLPYSSKIPHLGLGRSRGCLTKEVQPVVYIKMFIP